MKNMFSPVLTVSSLAILLSSGAALAQSQIGEFKADQAAKIDTFVATDIGGTGNQQLVNDVSIEQSQVGKADIKQRYKGDVVVFTAIGSSGGKQCINCASVK